MLTSFSIGYFIQTRRKLYLLLTVANSVGLYASDSRGSILAIVIAIIIVIILRNKLALPITIALIVFQVGMMAFFYQNSHPEDFLHPEASDIQKYSIEGIKRSNTVIERGFFIWPKAIYLFLHSPIFGTGFGSFNDTPYELNGGIPYVFQFNNTSNHYFNDGHAHHTFLHVLAETGLVGLGLLLLLLFQIKKVLIK
ncbi:O-antigen ligase family protein [Paenibacillus sp. CC-CFT747]|nr:O-antigen ligase family protein [Paenibacillus sp. CC-CFT747]